MVDSRKFIYLEETSRIGHLVILKDQNYQNETQKLPNPKWDRVNVRSHHLKKYREFQTILGKQNMRH